MVLHSPAVHAQRPGNIVDPRRPGDYPILLGESLKGSGGLSGGLVSLRYNFKPEKGLTLGKSILTKHKAGPRSSYKIVVQDGATNETAYTYSGRDVSISRDELHQEPTALALVFDKSKSAFILDAISTCLDFNLTSAPLEPDKDVDNYPQIPAETPTPYPVENKVQNQEISGREDGHDTPDSTNPYDYRHFLDEAREAAEQTAAIGNRSPLPGSRTPASGMASPVPGATRFVGNGASTPQFRPTPMSAPAQKKRKADDIQEHSKARPGPNARNHGPAAAATPKKTPAQRKRGDSKTGTSQPLSKERISDSDHSSEADAEADMSDTITVARPQARQPLPSQKQSRAHTSDSRPTSSASASNFPRSPHIVVDDPSGLEIDMGSPPPSAASSRQRVRRVNRDAFRSQTGTPSLSHSGHNKQAKPGSDVDMGLDAENENDITMSDNDVEEFELGSPRTNTRTIGSSHASSRIQSVAPDGSDEDEDDALAAELEAALEEEEQQQQQRENKNSTAVGLGISGTTATVGDDDDESEVSEEE
jgi:RNA polymerase II transcription elongation factor